MSESCSSGALQPRCCPLTVQAPATRCSAVHCSAPAVRASATGPLALRWSYSHGSNCFNTTGDSVLCCLLATMLEGQAGGRGPDEGWGSCRPAWEHPRYTDL